MARLRFRGRIAAWVALAGIAGGTLAPLFAHARPGAAQLAAEICSTTGLKHAGGKAPADAPARDLRPSHCSLCTFGAERAAAAQPAAPLALADSGASESRPGFFETARLDSPLDRNAHPRAPPTFS